jgi:hypothetical protein
MRESAVRFRRALELDPWYVNARVNLIRVLVGLRDVAGANAALREGLALDPASPELGALVARR